MKIRFAYEHLLGFAIIPFRI